jgi:hypothetical protein
MISIYNILNNIIYFVLFLINYILIIREVTTIYCLWISIMWYFMQFVVDRSLLL